MDVRIEVRFVGEVSALASRVVAVSSRAELRRIVQTATGGFGWTVTPVFETASHAETMGFFRTVSGEWFDGEIYTIVR